MDQEAARIAVGEDEAPASVPASEDAELDTLVTALLTASRVLVGISARSLAEVEDAVTVAQFRTLVVLHTHGPTRLNRLAARLQVNASTALRSVDRLVAAGLVDRRPNPGDRREVVIELLAAGRRMVDDVTARRRAAMLDTVRAMPANRRAQMVETLLAFARAADEPPAASDPASTLGW